MQILGCFHMKKYVLVVFLSFLCPLGCRKANDLSSRGGDVMHSNFSSSRLSADLKGRVSPEVTVEEIQALLGPPHCTLGSGISIYVWYFDDDTCLLAQVFDAEKNAKELYWRRYSPPAAGTPVRVADIISSEDAKEEPRP